MKNLIFLVILVQCILFGCDSKNPNQGDLNTDINSLSSNVDTSFNSLKKRLMQLDSNCPDFSDFQKVIASNSPYQDVVDKEEENWIYNLEREDSIQFQKADLLKPLCKLFENNEILSVMFTDIHDYHQAIQIFNFRKPDIAPVSSFILHSEGGDAEDFWNIKGEKFDQLTFKITETIGHYNNFEIQDTTYIDLKKYEILIIDENSGEITREIQTIKRDTIEVN